MCIHIPTCVYVYIYIYIYMPIYISLSLYIYIYIYIYTHTHIHTTCNTHNQLIALCTSNIYATATRARR